MNEERAGSGAGEWRETGRREQRRGERGDRAERRGPRGQRSGRRGSRGPRNPEPPETGDLAGWLAGRLPDEWFEEPPELTVDREEITVLGRIAPPELDTEDEAGRAAAESGRIQRFREETRDRRIEVAREAERRYDRTVSWGAVCGDTRELFTTLSVPVMSRLRQPQRQVLDTLVDAGVARSRSEALAWCVELVARHQSDWIQELRDALVAVERARSTGPDL